MIQTSPTPETLGTYAAIEAIAAGGQSPWDCEGNCLLPTTPTELDYDFLAEQLSSVPTSDEREEFRVAFAARMRAAIQELIDSK